MNSGDHKSGYIGTKTTKMYTYEGEMDRNGGETGEGVRTFAATGERQEGQFKNGLRDGVIKTTTKNGFRVDQYNNDALVRVLEAQQNDTYWKFSRQVSENCFEGEKRWPGHVYTGQLSVDGTEQGKGTLVTDEGETITGNWEHGEYNGEMFMEWKNGDWKRSRYKSG